jgi:hypothetical protein
MSPGKSWRASPPRSDTRLPTDRQPPAPTIQERGQHHVAIPAHASLRIGTLAAILDDVAQHLSLERDELVRQLFENR